MARGPVSVLIFFIAQDIRMFPIILLPILFETYKRATPNCGGDCQSILNKCTLHPECCKLHTDNCLGGKKFKSPVAPFKFPEPARASDFITVRQPVAPKKPIKK